tara:strand:- start:95 stop:703 length:609 start_codon:yes stop_codon:yes gene_type:complete
MKIAVLKQQKQTEYRINNQFLISGRRCEGRWYGKKYIENCWDTGGSVNHSSDNLINGGTLVLPILLIVGLIFIFKKFNRGKIIGEYVLWYTDNIDNSVSIGNSYMTEDFLIIKDKDGNILEEISIEDARFRCRTCDDPQVYKFKDLDEFMTEYIIFYNKNNIEQADQMISKKRGNDFVLYNSDNEIIKTINLDNAYDELRNK